MALPKVLLIHTGGTLGMPRTARGEPLKPDNIRHRFQDHLEPLRKIADVDVDILLNLDSSDIHPEHWKKLARRIDQKIKNYAGIVVIHGTDTLAWTSTALSFMLKGLPIPVVLTGSQRPLEAMRSDAPRNLLNSVEVAVSGPPGVLVVFGDRILEGANVTKDSIFHFDAFRSNHVSTLGRIGLDITWRGKKRRSRRYWLDTRLKTNVGLLTLYPGFSPSLAQTLLDQPVEALVLEAFGAGNIPLGEHTLSPILTAAQQKHIPVVITSQCRHGTVNPDLYAGAREAKDSGAAFAMNMTREAVVIKTMVMLGRKVSYRRFGKEFEKNWVGEIGTENFQE